MKCLLCRSEIPKENIASLSAVCPSCRAYISLYKPQPHQVLFHKDPSPIKAVLGGFGSGKSLTTDAEVVDHVLSIPGSRFLITAPIIKQLEQAELPTILSLIPKALIRKHHKKDNTLELINDSTILFYSSEDEQKMRSLNLSGYKIEEASGVKQSLFEQLPARLRLSVANKNYNKNLSHNAYLTLICSNPANNWIRSEVLLKSNKIYASTLDDPHTLKLISSIKMNNLNNCNQFSRDISYVNPYMSTHLHTSFMNKYLPDDFIKKAIKSHDAKWVDRFIYGSFDYADGAVYPTFRNAICEPFPIPAHFPRLVAMDFGGKDPTALIFLAIDLQNGVVYAYDEYYVTSLNVKEHAKAIKPKLDAIPQGLMIRPLKADPAGLQKQIATQRSLFDHYAEFGIFCTPAYNNINAGLSKVATYLETGKLKIFSTCTNTIKEGSAYSYDLDKTVDKPVGGFDHLMDCLRYAMVELPDNPNDLTLFAGGYYITPEQKKRSNDRFLFEHALDLDSNPYPILDWYNS